MTPFAIPSMIAAEAEPARSRFRPRVVRAMLTAAVALGVAVPALAVDFDLSDEVSGSIITSLSTGFQMRLADRDPRNVGIYNGGASHSASTDDGNLNFDKYDVFSQISTVTSELSLKWRDFYLYARGTAFYDSIADANNLSDNGPAERPYRGEYNPKAQENARYGAQMLDYLIGYNYQLGDRYGTLKIGNQVLNWGEGLFTIGGISVINPIDVAKIRVPGAELRDALIPVPMISNSIDLFSGISLEAFYQWGFEPFKLEACGSYFSFTDALCDGAMGISVLSDYGDSRAYNAGTGQNPGDYDQAWDLGGPRLVSVNMKLQDDKPDSVNDWGVALRALVPELNNTEFQFYYMRYTSRLPSIKAVVPHDADGTGKLSGTGLVTAVPDLLGGVVSGLGVPALGDLASSLTGLLNTPVASSVTDIVAALADPLAQPLVDALLTDGSGGAYGTYPRSAVLENLENTVLHKYYPSGIDMVGFAFNTLEEWSGVAINFEVSWKHNVPVFKAETDFVVTTYNNAGGVPVDPVTDAPITALGAPGENPGIAPIVNVPGTASPDFSSAGPNTVYLDEKHDMWVASLRFTKLFAATDLITEILGASGVTALVEFGALYFDLNKDQEYASYGQFGYSGFGTSPLSLANGLTVVPPIMATDLPAYGPDGFYFPETGKAPTRWSGGVQGLIFWDYPNILSGVTLTPAVGFSSGLFGTTPSPHPGFTKSVHSVNFQLKADYLNNTSVIVNYYKSWGGGGGAAGARNPYIDRDFVGVTLNYQF
ncbi:DUF1302 domain-containing protein [Zavarzinia compransoris]|uniref:DUF1302 domain-containing protein n=1 Tax=Zavarzinia marina TaxID=2911065 RepID=UPI001F357D42|nr:DUF1302 family protein [Zavarzinia marina]MCF4165703.1 DUF1302 domain-containing protein [Zavarzinia marina]